ncbi:unnamed protein product [Rotaria sp. Silwood1]|nr:unnamed protein product [Rotaria sp. Silwood1]
MDVIHIRKNIDNAISDPVVRNEARRYSIRTRLAFLPDEYIGESWFFRLLTLVYYYFFVYFHGFEIEGIDKIDPNDGCLFFARHSTHNGEILGTIVCMYHMTGRVLRSLMHRCLTPFFPVLRLMGAVPGEPKSALSLLKSGFWVGVMPGGADEGMIGHENAYKVCWPKTRKGFAHIAIDAQVPIVPLFISNIEEMRWNPMLWFWNLLGLGRLFSYILQLHIPYISPILLLLASTVWFLATPVLRLMGAVPGEPKSALSLLKSGFWVGVMPGGADEGMIGHENAYKVCWPKTRKGFAHIAIDAQVPIVPLFISNIEEMRWNPILWFWNLLGLGRLFSYILQLHIPYISPILLLLASTVWFLATFIQIPIPAKIILHVGDPVQYDMSKDSIDDVVERAKIDLQSLINRHQPHGISYSNAVKERFQCLIKQWKKH